MNTFILVIWSVTAISGIARNYDWRYMGEFQSQSACVIAAAQLGIDKEKFRCLSTK